MKLKWIGLVMMNKNIIRNITITFLGMVTVLGAISAHAQNAPFSPVVEIDGRIYLAGHLGRDPETRALPEGIKDQTRQTLKNIGATLATINATHADIVRCQVFLADIGDFSAMNEVYRTFFPEHPPARTTVAVAGLAINAKIEIECTAIRGSGIRRRAANNPD